MRAYAPSMTIRPFLAFAVTIAVLFASAFTGVAAASAVVPMHDNEMMAMGHCSSASSKHDSKGMTKQCCIAMCMAVAIAPTTPDRLPLIIQSAATFQLPKSHVGYLGEIATPPPRLS